MKVEGKSKKTTSKKSDETQAKKRKVTEMIESFEISSDSGGEGEREEEEMEKKSLRERIQRRKTKITDYAEELSSGDESVEKKKTATEVHMCMCNSTIMYMYTCTCMLYTQVNTKIL